MKVILLQDVARIGARFDVKDVPDGHALNYLIPQKLAEPATKEGLKRLEGRKEKLAADAASVEEAFTNSLIALKDKTVGLSVEANEQGHLFKGIKASDVAAALQSGYGGVTEGDIVLTEPIKEIGDHTIEVKRGEHSSTFTLSVDRSR